MVYNIFEFILHILHPFARGCGGVGVVISPRSQRHERLGAIKSMITYPFTTALLFVKGNIGRIRPIIIISKCNDHSMVNKQWLVELYCFSQWASCHEAFPITTAYQACLMKNLVEHIIIGLGHFYCG